MSASQPAEPAFPWADDWPEITDGRVRAAFAKVERALFIEPHLRDFAGDDAPLPIGEGQTISQPFIVALMLQALHLSAGERVLEIGAGSGFQTAILCELLATDDAPSGASVYAIERLATLAAKATQVLADLGYPAHLRVSDGVLGWPDAAPFDAILVAAATAHVPKPLWEQLVEGGRMVLPLGATQDDQELVLLHKIEGKMKMTRLGGVRFVPLISPLLADPKMWAETV
ncbi:MAG: protein-L-isoaspartate(D-aspartate) O-methyltransferase [Anaerolineales bacterium]|nr:protein-L-isoaspartate(D-aspartate) O-methyltransferase [Anaerolineales bacterium]